MTWSSENWKPEPAEGVRQRRERAFDLVLPAVVTGVDAGGRRFEEATEVLSISADEAAARIHAPLGVGARIVLSLDIPRTLILEKPLRLCVSGTVAAVRPAPGPVGGSVVTIALDKAFKLQAAPLAEMQG